MIRYIWNAQLCARRLFGVGGAHGCTMWQKYIRCVDLKNESAKDLFQGMSGNLDVVLPRRAMKCHT